ncbi:polysaccharide biosynthesis/export family protein [Microvirga sp. KLBC 81]|uniref:polysaccharide biosynthesis/export family protein n=1 Tax=Microvirga sp. KLBC 81 TaxID=1862707 RepID=UPI00140220A9|nr:polysaccharide biosynthesis/export family protein [Microvirga sp. KLBC 81]
MVSFRKRWCDAALEGAVKAALVPVHKYLSLLVTLPAFTVALQSSVFAADVGRYVVQPGDLLSISVYQWPEHSGDVRVDINGEISRPAVGHIPVAGQALEEIEVKLRTELSKQIDLRNAPIVVSIAEYRPITVLGAVNNPGRHRYEVGLTVLDALALSGGPLSLFPRGSAFDQAVRQVEYYEKASVDKIEYLSALVRRERLLAEKVNQDKLELPANIASMLKAAGQEDIAEQEQSAFVARKSAFSQQRSAIIQQASVYKEEIDGLKGHMVEILAAISKVEEEYKRLQSLLERGLIRRVDLVTVDNQLTTLQSNLRAAIVAHAGAKSQMVKAEASGSELEQTRLTEIEKELGEVEKTIKTLEVSRATRASLDPAQGMQMNRGAAIGEDVGIDGLNFTLTRRASDGQMTTIGARAQDSVMPGDILTIAVLKRSF